MDASRAEQRDHRASGDGSLSAEDAGGAGRGQGWLRAVAEEARAAFPRWREAPELVLIDVDPRHVHAFWSLPVGIVDAARRALRADGEDAPMLLRLREAHPEGITGSTIDVEVVGLHGYRYVDIWGECRRYTGELGLLRPDGTLLPLIGDATVVLPAIGPTSQRAAAGHPEGAEKVQGAAPPQAAPQAAAPQAAPQASLPEPVGHPFPLPPGEGDAYDPLAAMGAPAAAPATPPAPGAPFAPHAAPAATDAAQPAAQPGAAPARADAPPAPTGTNGASPDLPEPVRHPFPLPPAESFEFDPFALVGGFVPPDVPQAALNGHPADADAAPSGVPQIAAESMPGEAVPGEAVAGEAMAGEAMAGEAMAAEPALPLQTVLALSSYALGQEFGEEHLNFEVNAELRVFGRARPGSRLELFGQPVRLRPDGTFSVTRPLPRGSLLLTSLLVETGDEPAS